MASTDGLVPSFVKLYYESVNAPHVMTIPVSLVAGGMPGGTFELFAKDNSQVNWITAITAYVNLLKAMQAPTSTFQYAELYSQPTADDSPQFLDTAVLGIAGTGVAAVVPASQIVWSIRSDLGGKGFVYLMDGNLAVNQKLKAPTYNNASVLAVVNYLIGSSGVVLCRDNGYPVVVTKVLTKTNDALRRRYRIN